MMSCCNCSNWQHNVSAVRLLHAMLSDPMLLLCHCQCMPCFYCLLSCSQDFAATCITRFSARRQQQQTHCTCLLLHRPCIIPQQAAAGMVYDTFKSFDVCYCLCRSSNQDLQTSRISKTPRQVLHSKVSNYPRRSSNSRNCTRNLPGITASRVWRNMKHRSRSNSNAGQMWQQLSASKHLEQETQARQGSVKAYLAYNNMLMSAIVDSEFKPVPPQLQHLCVDRFCFACYYRLMPLGKC